MNCGQSIIAACDGTTWNFIKAADGTAYTDAQIKRQFELFVNKVVAMGTYFISYALAQGTSGMSVNMIKAMNALRCAFTAGFSNFWYLLAAAFFAARQFGFTAEFQTKVDEYYPYFCTCESDYE